MAQRKLAIDENTRVVTANDFIKSRGLEKATLKAVKLLYIAISQCRMKDDEFYESSISVPYFAQLMNIDPSNVYAEADKLTDELMKAFIVCFGIKGSKGRKYSLFSYIDYTDDNEIVFRLNKDMTNFLLGITGDFTKPLLDDFLRMKSVYSIRVWHLIQKAMKSQKPAFAIEGLESEYYVTLADLREVTGTQDKLLKMSDFRNVVLDKALREIDECAGVKLTYRYQKKGKTIVGFYFKVVPMVTVTPEQAQLIDERMETYKEEVPAGQISFTEYNAAKNNFVKSLSDI